jgi:hypothetical protein
MREKLQRWTYQQLPPIPKGKPFQPYKKKGGRGGSRDGAGRKPKSVTERVRNTQYILGRLDRDRPDLAERVRRVALREFHDIIS